jgi:hypothetical protein
MTVARLGQLWRALGAAPLPAPIDGGTGTWSGTLGYKYLPGAEPEWLGDAHIRDVTTVVPGIAGPLRIDEARLRLGARPRVEIAKGSVAGIGFSGEITLTRNRPSARIAVPAVTAAALEAALAPALRRDQNLLARTLRRPPALPDWLRTRKFNARIEIGTLDLGGQALEDVRGQFAWNGAVLDAGSLVARMDGAGIVASVEARVDSREPAYRGRFAVTALDWREGVLDFSSTFDASGTGAALAASLTLDGSFTARDFTATPGLAWKSASGCFRYRPGGSPRFELTGLEARSGEEVFHGEGSGSAEGRLAIELNSTQRQLRLSGRMSGLRMDFSDGKESR